MKSRLACVVSSARSETVSHVFVQQVRLRPIPHRHAPLRRVHARAAPVNPATRLIRSRDQPLLLPPAATRCSPARRIVPELRPDWLRRQEGRRSGRAHAASARPAAAAAALTVRLRSRIDTPRLGSDLGAPAAGHARPPPLLRRARCSGSRCCAVCPARLAALGIAPPAVQACFGRSDGSGCRRYGGVVRQGSLGFCVRQGSRSTGACWSCVVAITPSRSRQDRQQEQALLCCSGASQRDESAEPTSSFPPLQCCSRRVQGKRSMYRGASAD